MAQKNLHNFDPEDLLQELRARESIEVETDTLKSLFPCGRMPSAKLGIGGQVESISGLEDFKTKEIVDVLRQQQKVIYGVDDRQDMYEVTNRRILTDADSVVALVPAVNITDNGNGTSTLRGENFGNRLQLCQSEPFRDQTSVAMCSGFLVDPNMVATAAHCIDNNTLNTIRFVFDFEMTDANTENTSINNNEIYRGIRILGRQIGTQGTDWAVIQLDRPVRNHPYVKIRRRGKIRDGSALHVIGHPVGLPKKYAGGSIVRDNDQTRYFVTNADTYGGNSGSPIFNSSTHRVEGILVRGETDFVWNGRCRVSNICPANGCRGEDCTRTTEFDHIVPRNRHDFIPFNPNRTEVVKIRNRWKITVGNMLMLDFGSSEKEARKAHKIIQHYKLNNQCFVGRPHPSMEFYLVDGMSPEGPLSNEDAIPFNPRNIQVQRVRGRWKIVEDNHWIMDFNQSQGEAWQALSYILYYGFSYICFVGRPHPSMTYFRR